MKKHLVFVLILFVSFDCFAQESLYTGTPEISNESMYVKRDIREVTEAMRTHERRKNELYAALKSAIEAIHLQIQEQKNSILKSTSPEFLTASIVKTIEEAHVHLKFVISRDSQDSMNANSIRSLEAEFSYLNAEKDYEAKPSSSEELTESFIKTIEKSYFYFFKPARRIPKLISEDSQNARLIIAIEDLFSILQKQKESNLEHREADMATTPGVFTEALRKMAEPFKRFLPHVNTSQYASVCYKLFY